MYYRPLPVGVVETSTGYQSEFQWQNGIPTMQATCGPHLAKPTENKQLGMDKTKDYKLTIGNESHTIQDVAH